MRIFCDISFFLALIFKMFSLGVNYYPVLDDYIQYGGYPLYEKLSYVYLHIGTIVTRPFASILDPLLWGKFYPNLWIVLFAVVVMFFFGAKFIARTLEELDIHITPFLYAVLLLIPLGFEGTYWLSASTRISLGLFFAGASSVILIKFIKTKKAWLLLPYIVTTILSFGFYESVMILSFLLQLFVIVTLIKDKKKIALLLITPVISGILMLLFYKLAGNIGALGSRANSFSFAGIHAKIIDFFAQFFEIIVKGGLLTTVKGALFGITILVSSVYGIFTLVIAILISALCGYFGKESDFFAKPKVCIPSGLVLTFLPLAPNVLAQEVWLTFRSVVPCFIGLVLVSAPVFSKLLKSKNVRMAVIFIMVLLFSLGNVNELDTYRRVSSRDDYLVTEIAEQLDADVLSGDKNTVVVLAEEIITPQVSYYKDHVKSVFSSDWALTGAVRAKCKNVKIKMITPVYSLEDFDAEGMQIIYIGGADE